MGGKQSLEAISPNGDFDISNCWIAVSSDQFAVGWAWKSAPLEQGICVEVARTATGQSQVTYVKVSTAL
jgi:hypothetical protein